MSIGLTMTPTFQLRIQEYRQPTIVHTLDVRWHTSIKHIKDQLRLLTNMPVSRMHLFHSSSPKTLSNSLSLHDLGIDESGHELRLAMKATTFHHSTQYLLIPSKDIEADVYSKVMIDQVRQGLENQQLPIKTDLLDCTGGVYFMRDGSGARIAVFKPNDEEQGMPNNPKGYDGNGEQGLRPYFKPGHGYLRESAAYVMDVNNFAGVPATTVVHCEHPSFHYESRGAGGVELYPKVGSLQKFIATKDTFDDVSPSKISVLELQKIALLDMRILNGDRNAANMLAIHTQVSAARKGSRSASLGSYSAASEASEDWDFNFEEDDLDSSHLAGGDAYLLIPIDHGYAFPTHLLINEYDWAWFYCRQISQEVDPAIKAYMNSIDIEDVLAKLKQQFDMPEEAIFLLRIAHQLILDGINSGLTLRDIAELIARVDEDTPSPLEVAVKYAEENSHRALEARSGRWDSRSPSTSPRRATKVKTKLSDGPSYRRNSKNSLPDEEMAVVNSSAKRNAASFIPERMSPVKLKRVTESQQDFSIHHDNLSKKLEKQVSSLAIGVSHPSAIQIVDDSQYFMSDLTAFSDDKEDKGTLKFNRFAGRPLKVLSTIDSAYFPHHSGGRGESTTKRAVLSRDALRRLSSKQSGREPEPKAFQDSLGSSPSDRESGETSAEASSYECGSPVRVAEHIQKAYFASLSKTNSLDVEGTVKVACDGLAPLVFPHMAVESPKGSALSFEMAPGSQLSSKGVNICSPDTAVFKKESRFNVDDSLEYSPHTSDDTDDELSELNRHLACHFKQPGIPSNDSAKTSSGSLSTTPTSNLETELSKTLEKPMNQVLPIGLTRVVSFGAFDSPPIYDTAKVGRQFLKLRRERRKDIEKLPAFQNQKLKFGLESVAALVQKERRAKVESH